MDALSLSQLEMIGIVLLIFLVLFVLVVSCFREWSLRIYKKAFDMSSIRCALAWVVEDRVDYALQIGVIVPALLIVLLAALLLYVRMDPNVEEFKGEVQRQGQGLGTSLFYKGRARRIALASIGNRPWQELSLGDKISYYMLYGLVTLCDLFFLPFCPSVSALKSMTRTALMLNLLPMCLVILLMYNDFSVERCRVKWSARLRLPERTPTTTYTLAEFIKAAKESLDPLQETT